MQDENLDEVQETNETAGAGSAPQHSDVQAGTMAEEQLGPAEASTDPKPVVVTHKSSRKKLWATVAVVAVVGLGVGAWFLLRSDADDAQTTTVAKQATAPAETTKTEGLVLDTSKNYGDKYADGVLPVGDDKYVTDGPKTGYVYACGQYAQSQGQEAGGAEVRGPWFTNNNTEYDLNKKVQVQGSVNWEYNMSNVVSGSTRTITTNDLPDHETGTFPVASSDPAYQYDRNPNTISSQNLTYALNAAPTYGATPNCMGGESGVMLTGAALFNAFDAGGRDAGAWEVQDGCDGHPQKDGEYHYHTLTSCIKDASVHTVIGFALDGFPITGPKVGDKNYLTTSDLDECHGITSEVTLDGKKVTSYHYVMTQDFPYSVSCFRSTPIQPPGQQGPPTARP